MSRHIGLVSLVVKDYDEAIDFYTRALGFKLIEDTKQQGKRWVVVAPSSGGTGLLLAKATNETQANSVGNQTGGRVFLFLYTNDFSADYEKMVEEGVVFLEMPREEEYGRVVVFQDLYGNKWDLLQLKKKVPTSSQTAASFEIDSTGEAAHDVSASPSRPG